MEWNGVEWMNEWNGMDEDQRMEEWRNGMEWNGMCNSMESNRNGMEMEWNK